jgi:2,4-dienoyl-CoA reductase-like NADH-dependent reductase (Old Yellow Enzyme family)
VPSGLITEPKQEADIRADGSADAVFLARELLREPQWPMRAAAELGGEVPWPEQYLRAKEWGSCDAGGPTMAS